MATTLKILGTNTTAANRMPQPPYSPLVKRDAERTLSEVSASLEESVDGFVQAMLRALDSISLASQFPERETALAVHRVSKAAPLVLFEGTDVKIVPDTQKSIALHEIRITEAQRCQDLYQAIQTGASCFEIVGDPPFKEKVLSNIKLLLTRPSGRELIQAIVSFGQKIKIYSYEKSAAARATDKSLCVYLHLDSPTYLICIDHLKSVMEEVPPHIILAHELIHILHFIEEGEMAPPISKETNPKAYDLEEQITIHGDATHPLCENAIRRQFSLNLRLSHLSSAFIPFDPDVHDVKEKKEGRSRLEEAAYLGLTAEIRKLLEAGADPTEELKNIILAGYPEAFRCLLEGGMSPDLMIEDQPLLHYILSKRPSSPLTFITYLVRHGVSLDARDRAGRTALHVALMNAQYEEAELLVQCGASVEILTPSHQSPLEIVILQGDVALVKLLLLYGAKVSRAAQDALAEFKTMALAMPIEESKKKLLIHAEIVGLLAKYRLAPQAPISFKPLFLR